MTSLKNDIHELVCKLKDLAKEMGKTPTRRDFLANGVRKIVLDRCGGHNAICRAAGLEINKGNRKGDDITVVIRPPRILFFDIETFPIITYTWDMKPNYIPIEMMITDWAMLSYAGQFLGEKEIEYFDQRKYAKTNVRNDLEQVQRVHALLKRTDVLVAHNVMFDWGKVNAKFLEYELEPLNHLVLVDTWRIATRVFKRGLTSGKLVHLAEFLKCKNRKGGHKKYPGFAMWRACEQNLPGAFQECEEYNKMDVTVLEEVYHKLVKYDPSINFQSFYYGTVCTCGGKKFRKDGHKYTKQGKFQMFRCNNCAKIFTAKENMIHKDTRKQFFK